MLDYLEPNIFIVGAAKCGTTSLWAYLKQHPNLVSSIELKDKELGYYCNLFGTNDYEYYISKFPYKDGATASFEACTSYLTSPETPILIKENIENPKIIIIIRNPIERAFSLYNWMAFNGYEYSSSFEKALERELIRKRSNRFRKSNQQYFYNYLYAESGQYYNQIKRYIDCLSRDSVHIIIYEEFKTNTEKMLNDICSFIGIQDYPFNVYKKHNTRKTAFYPSFQFINRMLVSKLIGKGLNLNKTSNWLYHNITKLNTSNSTPSINKNTESRLLNYYINDVVKLENLLDIPLQELWFSSKCKNVKPEK